MEGTLSLGSLITIVMFIFTILAGAGGWWNVKFQSKQNKDDIKDLGVEISKLKEELRGVKERSIPGVVTGPMGKLADDLKCQIRDRVHKNDCKYSVIKKDLDKKMDITLCEEKEKYFKMNTENIEKKLVEHGKQIEKAQDAAGDLTKTIIDAQKTIAEAMEQLKRQGRS